MQHMSHLNHVNHVHYVNGEIRNQSKEEFKNLNFGWLCIVPAGKKVRGFKSLIGNILHSRHIGTYRWDSRTEWQAPTNRKYKPET